METPDFYIYAADVDWFVTTLIDIYSNSKGMKLKALLEDAIKEIDQDLLFKDFFQYTRLPNNGVVPQ